MRRNGWHILWRGDALIVARRLPARFDIVAETRLPAVGRPLRLAHQVRQDVWRALRDLRGFSPCIEVAPADEEVAVRAGGRAARGAAHAEAEARIAMVLEDAGNRERWVRWAA